MSFTLGRQHGVCLRETCLFEQDRPIHLMFRTPTIYLEHDTEIMYEAQY